MNRRYINELKQMNVAVIGLGISGEGVLESLGKIGARCFVFDKNPQSALSCGEYVPIEKADLHEYDLAVISPGVPLTSKEAAYFVEKGVPVIGEIELAYRLTNSDIICITGTNGKTTTTSLCGEIFAAFMDSRVVGNIGIPAVPYALEDHGALVAEISSFQIETLRDFRAKICAVLNITPDHLDRHGTFEAYTALKLDLLRRGEIKIMNADCSVLASCSTEFEDAYFFSARSEQRRGAYVREGKIYVSLGDSKSKCPIYTKVDVSAGDVACADNSRGLGERVHRSQEEYICDISDIHLMGAHNVENVLCAALTARLYGIPAEIIRESIRRFRAVEHRIEYVDTVRGVRFYNDSKGTNPDSTIKAIEAMDASCHLIAGGYEKNSDFTEMLEVGRGRISSFALIGVTAERIRDRAVELGYSADSISVLPDMRAAVECAFSRAADGEIVLLSPASASWGMYRNFEERGRDFKELVAKLPR